MLGYGVLLVKSPEGMVLGSSPFFGYIYYRYRVPFTMCWALTLCLVFRVRGIQVSMGPAFPCFGLISIFVLS